MLPFHRRIVPLLGAAFCLVLGAPEALAQRTSDTKYKVSADDPELDSLLSPQIGSTSKNFRAKEWLEVEAKLFVQMAPEPKSKTLDKLTVRWYFAVENPEQRRTYLLFTREVAHVNIPTGEEIHVSCYMSPASIRRILGDARNAERAVEVVSYEVLIDDEVMAYETSNRKFDHKWWERAGESLIRSDVVPLLDKSQTPFSIMWWDRYAEIAPEAKN